MSNFITLLDAVEKVVGRDLGRSDLETLSWTMREIREVFYDMKNVKESAYLLFFLNNRIEEMRRLKKQVLLVWADPFKQKLTALNMAKDITMSLTKRFGTDMRRW